MTSVPNQNTRKAGAETKVKLFEMAQIEGLEEAPLLLVRDPLDQVLICCPSAIFRVCNDAAKWQSSEDMFEDDDFTMMTPEDDSSKTTSKKCSLTPVYKFKKPAVSFCRVQDLIFSLHTKNGRTVHVECARMGAENQVECLNSCVVIINIDFDVQNSWIVALERDHIITKVRQILFRSEDTLGIGIFFGVSGQQGKLKSNRRYKLSFKDGCCVCFRQEKLDDPRRLS